MSPDQIMQVVISAGSCITAIGVTSWKASAKMTTARAEVKLALAEVNANLRTINRDIEELQREIDEARAARGQLWERLNGLREKTAAHSARLELLKTRRKDEKCP